MTKRKPATRKSITKATASKTSPTKSSPKPPTAGRHNGAVLIVLGFDEQQKPRGARFENTNLDLVTKAAAAMGLKVYRATTAEVPDVVKKLPVGRLYATGRGFVPNIRQDLYSDLVVALALEPDEAVADPAEDKNKVPEARGLPRSWDEIGPGHLVIAQESQDYGWWEAVVIERKDETFTLRYRDYPHLPKFVRHRSAIALMYAPNGQPRSEGQPRTP
jgi:hypothetical protein